MLKSKKNVKKGIGKIQLGSLGKAHQAKSEISLKQKKAFEISAKRMMLTYSQVPESWTLDYVKEILVDGILTKERGKGRGEPRVKAYVIGEERHADGGKHYHCFIEFVEKYQLRNARKLDINGVHGQYEKAETTWGSIAYVKKVGNYITGGLPGTSNRLDSFIRASDRDAKLMVMEMASPELKLKLRQEILMEDERIREEEEELTKIPIYPFQECLRPFNREAGIFKEGRAMGLIMYGEANTGKSSLPRRVAKETGGRLTGITDPKGMTKNYKGENLILLDEMRGEEFNKPEMQVFLKTLVTLSTAETIAYYGVTKIAWPRTVFITTNEDASKWNFNDAGIRARFILVETWKDGKFQFKQFRDLKLVDMEPEEIKKRVSA